MNQWILSEIQFESNQNTFWKTKNKVKQPFIIGMYITEHNNFVLIGIYIYMLLCLRATIPERNGGGGGSNLIGETQYFVLKKVGRSKIRKRPADGF
jgi:hypothetical protein